MLKYLFSEPRSPVHLAAYIVGSSILYNGHGHLCGFFRVNPALRDQIVLYESFLPLFSSNVAAQQPAAAGGTEFIFKPVQQVLDPIVTGGHIFVLSVSPVKQADSHDRPAYCATDMTGPCHTAAEPGGDFRD